MAKRVLWCVLCSVLQATMHSDATGCYCDMLSCPLSASSNCPKSSSSCTTSASPRYCSTQPAAQQHTGQLWRFVAYSMHNNMHACDAGQEGVATSLVDILCPACRNGGRHCGTSLHTRTVVLTGVGPYYSNTVKISVLHPPVRLHAAGAALYFCRCQPAWPPAC